MTVIKQYNTSTSQWETIVSGVQGPAGPAGPNGPLVNLSDVGPWASEAYAIGDTGPAGGIIFLTPSTVGNTTGKFFEAAPATQVVQRSWVQSSPVDYTNTAVSGAEGSALGTGQQNTLDIIAQGNTNPATSAAAFADAFTYGGFSDWYLPSIDELKTLAKRIDANGISSEYRINPWGATYLSSTEASIYSNAEAFNWNFGYYSYGGSTSKGDTNPYVVPIRSFTGIPAPVAKANDYLKFNGTEWINSPISNATPTVYGPVKGLTGDYNESVSFGFNGSSDISLLQVGSSNTYVFTLIGTTFAAKFAEGSYANFDYNYFIGKSVNIVSYGPTYISITGTATSVTANTVTITNPSEVPSTTTETTSYFGFYVPQNTTGGWGNTLLGRNAGKDLVISDSDLFNRNTAIGDSALINTTGEYGTYDNTAIGWSAGTNTTGSSNIFIGSKTGSYNYQPIAAKQLSNMIWIGPQVGNGISTGASNITLIGNFDTSTITSGETAIGVNGYLGLHLRQNRNLTIPAQTYANYQLASNVSYNNSAQNVTVPFNYLVTKSDNANFNTANGRLTATHTGIYIVNCGLYATSDVVQLWGVVNGVRDRSFQLGSGPNMAGTGMFKLNAGDNFGIAGWFSGGTTTIYVSNEHSYLKIRYLG